MYKINKSVQIEEDWKEDLLITDGAVVEVATDYHGDLYLHKASRVVLRGDLHGFVGVYDNSVVEYYGTIHNGIDTYGDSDKRRFYKPMSLSAYVISCSVEDYTEKLQTDRKLTSGQITPPLHPSCKT